MKKVILCLLCGILLIGITGCNSKEKQREEKQNIIEEFGIAEGCYSSDNNKEHLICFTNDLARHDVLYKDGTYYNDIYYKVSPPTEEKSDYYEFTYSDKTLNIKYYSNNELYATDVCYSTGSKVLKCTRIGDELVVKDGKFEFTLNKVEKEFNKEIIESLPVYERNKEYKIIFDNETITCNLTRAYSILNSFAGSSAIKKCLESHFGKEYQLTSLDKTGNWHIYPNGSLPSGASNEQQFNYILNNYSYNVSLNGKSFEWKDAFPIDPYATDEIMTIKIEKIQKEINVKEAYKEVAGWCYLQEHVNGESWVEFNLCFDENLDKAYTWKNNLGDMMRDYKKYNLTNENGVLQYGNTKIYLSTKGIILDGEPLLTGEDKSLFKFVKFKNSCGLQEWLGNSCG